LSDLPYDIERALARCFDSVRSVEASGDGQGRMTEDIAALRGLLGQLVADRDAARAELAKAADLWDQLLAAAKGIAELDDGSVLTNLGRWSRLHEAVDAIVRWKAAKPAGMTTGGGCAGDFAGQLPKGPALGRFTAAERSELDGLKRKAFEAAKPAGGAD
jgi:hypothetical protein